MGVPRWWLGALAQVYTCGLALANPPVNATMRSRVLRKIEYPILPVTGREPLPHVPLDDMVPFTLNGRVMRPKDMDGLTDFGTTWPRAFQELIETRLAENPGPSTQGRDKYFFDKLFCIGAPKSGTTTIHRVWSSLFGVKTTGPWTGPLADGMHSGTLMWFQKPEAWREFYPALKGRIAFNQGFEDTPWTFLYRVYPSLVEDGASIGYVFTIRDCRKHAESSAAYNNRNKHHANTPYWISDHCARQYRRCHLHQADVYRYFAIERPRDKPLNDLLIVEMSSELAEKNWKRFRKFMFGGGHAAYVSKDKPAADNGKGKDGLNLDSISSIPRTNGRPKWQNRKYCKTADFAPWEDQVLGSNLLKEMVPPLVSNFCTLPEVRKNPDQQRRCRRAEHAVLQYFRQRNLTLPEGLFPQGWRASGLN